MRVAFFAWESLHSVSVGGVAAHVTELSAALRCRRHEVHNFVRLGEGQRTYDVVDGVHYAPLSHRFESGFRHRNEQHGQ